MNKTVTSAGIDLATEAFGRPSDPAIVLIMGSTASMLGWPDALCHGLADQGFYVIRFDHRDTGQTTTVPPGEATYTVEDMASDVIAILDAYDLPQATLMGMSLGGYIAQMVALKHPDRVRSLILYASEPLGWDGPDLPHIAPEFLDHFNQLSSLDWSNAAAVSDFLLTIERLSRSTGMAFDETATRQRIHQVLKRARTPASMFNHASLTTREDWTGRLRDLSCPTLVLHGALDPILPPDNARALNAMIAGSELVIVPRLGHALPSAILPTFIDTIARHTRASLNPQP